MNNKIKKITFRLNQEEFDKLDTLRSRDSINVSRFLRSLIKKYVSEKPLFD